MTKSSKPLIRIHNAETDEIIDREMTNDEFLQYQMDVEGVKIMQAEAESKATRRQEILEKLGLTNDEAQLLLG